MKKPLGLLAYEAPVTFILVRLSNHAKADVFGYIARFYNPTRRNSALDYLSLMDFERQAQVA